MTHSTIDRQLHTVLDLSAEWMERLSWSRPAIRAHQQLQLRRLLLHAQQHSPFHGTRLAGVDPSTFTLDQLGELPVMTKTEMMRDFDRVVTDPRITRTVVEDHLARSGTELRHLLGEYVVMASGGSSGERGVFVYDDEGFVSFALSIVRETLAKVRAFGITADAPLVGAMVAAGSAAHATAAVAQMAAREPSPVRMELVPATLPFDEIVARLNDLQPLYLLAYSSVLVRLAAAKHDGRLTVAPFAVGSTSELFTDDQRAAVEQAFGVPAGNTFGSTEGLVGTAAPGESALRFAEDTCIVELVDGAGAPVAHGARADRVLVTNLVNFVQPLIRYELTDRFVEVGDQWPDGHLRAVVAGRVDEPLRWGAYEMHPFVVRSELIKHPGVHEYQVRQTPSGLDISLVATDDIDAACIGRGVTEALATAGLTEPSVSICRVAAVDRDPATGKARRFVPLTEATAIH
jgi:phenylacetate-CoA ligase